MLPNQAGREIVSYDEVRKIIRDAYTQAGYGLYLDVMAITEEVFVRTTKSRLEIVEEYAWDEKNLPDGYVWQSWERQYISFFYLKMKLLYLEHGEYNGVA